MKEKYQHSISIHPFSRMARKHGQNIMTIYSSRMEKPAFLYNI